MNNAPATYKKPTKCSIKRLCLIQNNLLRKRNEVMNKRKTPNVTANEDLAAISSKSTLLSRQKLNT
jgi:hypothetical protein